MLLFDALVLVANARTNYPVAASNAISIHFYYYYLSGITYLLSIHISMEFESIFIIDHCGWVTCDRFDIGYELWHSFLHIQRVQMHSAQCTLVHLNGGNITLNILVQFCIYESNLFRSDRCVDSLNGI